MDAHADRMPQALGEQDQQRWNSLSPFQRRVLQELLRIPKGQTRSYQWVAKRIGKPGAARAVGSACRTNPFAPTVPCHRVIRADGSLGYYALGQARKRALLKAEGWQVGKPGVGVRTG
jgi:methylated-DNA-[protein]-cysteine S-methyltransferase